MRILVAEDDATLRGQLATALRAAGYSLDLAANGIDAEHAGRVEPIAT